MQSSLKVEINLFGMLSKYGEGDPLVIIVPSGANMKEVLQALKAELSSRFSDFNAHKVLDASVLADEKEVLKHDHILNQNVSLAILPPVCGG
jgi:molybdopterin converting factor small subunit